MDGGVHFPPFSDFFFKDVHRKKHHMDGRFYTKQGILMPQAMFPTQGNRLKTSIPNCEIGTSPYASVITGYATNPTDSDQAMALATQQLGNYTSYHHATPTKILEARPAKIFTGPRFVERQVLVGSVALPRVANHDYQHFNPNVYHFPVRNETCL